MKKILRSGYTTGTCAAAAAKGAALMLVRQALVSEVTIELPTGDSATFPLHGQTFTENSAACFVIKDAGDDPDVTNGAELHASVRRNPPRPPFAKGGSQISIEGGIGIGKVTKPGLAVPPGQWAINPVPRRMIEQAVDEVVSEFTIKQASFNIVISIPDGELRANKTLNARLGIIGGLSILGTTGIVRPISAKAWTDTIDAALDVARACGCQDVVLSTGRSSELAAQKYLVDLPEEAYIMMGDHVFYALQACAKRGFMQPVLVCQFAKLLKIACGHPNTHAAASELDLDTLRGWSEDAGISPDIISIISQANTAREIAIASGFEAGLMRLVAGHAVRAAALHAPGVEVQPLLCGYDGGVVVSFGCQNVELRKECYNEK